MFPVEGRPRGKELIVPPYELTTTADTETVPVRITTTALPTLFVGKSVTQSIGGPFQMAADNGITPYVWSSSGLPDGLSMNTSGIINGTPLELGLFNVTFAVQDSSVPFSVDEVTLQMTVETDLKVQIATGQSYSVFSGPGAQVPGSPFALVPLGTTLGDTPPVQVGTPYSVQMAVGNVNPSSPLPGGLPPYTWSAPAGSFPPGLSISPSGLISGVPATYTSDFSVPQTYAVTVQVTDAIGAHATQTYTMATQPAFLQFGWLNQPVIYAGEDFKLVVPVFGGTSPYTLDPVAGFVPAQDAAYYGPVVLKDGRVEVKVGLGAPTPGGFATTGQRSFQLLVYDSAGGSVGQQFNFSVKTTPADVLMGQGQVVKQAAPDDSSWADIDGMPALGYAVGIDPSAGVGLSRDPTSFLLPLAGAAPTGANTSYTVAFGPAERIVPGAVYVVSLFNRPGNNGAFTCVSGSTTQLVLNNPFGEVETLAPAVVAVLTSVAAPYTPGVAVYVGTVPNGANNALAGTNVTVSGFGGANDGTFGCYGSSLTRLWLGNASATNQSGSATALSTYSAQAQLATMVSDVYGDMNGVAIALDATASPPVVDWHGPNLVSPNIYAGATSAAPGNADSRVNLYVSQSFQVTNAAPATGAFAGLGTAYYGAPGTFSAFTGSTGPFSVSGFTAVGGLANPLNNGLFNVLYLDANTVVLANPAGVPEYSTAAHAVNTFALEWSSRDFTSLTHGDPPTLYLASVQTATGSPATTTYTGAILAPTGAYAGYYFSVNGFTGAPAGATGYFLCTGNTNQTVTLANPNGVGFTGTGHCLGDIGVLNSYARPYIVGDVVGFNPRNPYFNSPDVYPLNSDSGLPSPYSDGTWTARVAVGSALPPGLSLDKNTGLIYGPLVGVGPATSVVEYADAFGVVHGTATIWWSPRGVGNFLNDFQMTDNGVLDGLTVRQAYGSGPTDPGAVRAFTAPSGISLSGASIAYGKVPYGMQVGTDGTNIVVFGTPGEAGYFDVWFQAQSTSGQATYVYTRMSAVGAVPSVTQIPVSVVGWAYTPYTPGNAYNSFPLPHALYSSPTPTPYSVQLVAVNGQGPTFYSWSSTPGIAANCPGMANISSAGVISGGPTNTFNVPFSFTVNDGSTMATVSNISLISTASTLTFNTPSIPTWTSGVANSATFTASGGVTPYQWTISPLNVNPLPAGLTFSAGGVLSGTTTAAGYSKPVTFRVTDSALPTAAYVDRTFTITVVSGLSLRTGIDARDGTSTGVLGYVAAGNVSSINPRPNLSFYVVATGVVSVSIANISASVSYPGITATVVSLSGGTANIQLTGAGFDTPSVPSTPTSAPTATQLTVTVVDSGTSTSGTFTWYVYNNGGTLLVSPTGNFPTE